MRALPFLLATWFLVLFSVPAAAESIDCVPDRACKKGETVPQCCERPPCEFFYELMEQKWMQRALLSDRTMVALVAELRGAEPATDWYSNYMNELMEQRRDFGGQCPGGRLALDTRAIFMTNMTTRCSMDFIVPGVGKFPFSSIQDVLDKTRSCKEFVEHDYELAQESVRECEASGDAVEGQAGALSERVWKGLLSQAESRTQMMEAHLAQYCSLCTCAPEAELARFVVRYANPPLKNIPPKKPMPKKKPKRAVKKGG